MSNFYDRDPLKDDAGDEIATLRQEIAGLRAEIRRSGGGGTPDPATAEMDAQRAAAGDRLAKAKSEDEFWAIAEAGGLTSHSR